MKNLLGILALLCLPGLAGAAPALVYDSTPGGAGGTLTYDGAGGSALGSGIQFVDIAAIDALLNPSVALDCANCVLLFATGANLSEGPAYQWLGGGTYALVGDVPTLGLVGATLLSGTFVATPNTPGFASVDTSGIFLSLGLGETHDAIETFYGFPHNAWNIGTTLIALQSVVVDGATGAFLAIPNQSDIVTTPVPEPATLLLLGSGLVGLVAVVRTRLR